MWSYGARVGTQLVYLNSYVTSTLPRKTAHSSSELYALSVPALHFPNHLSDSVFGTQRFKIARGQFVIDFSGGTFVSTTLSASLAVDVYCVVYMQ